MEEKWPHFKEEPRNIRISLATDGVNPFAQMKSIYMVWPIFVTTYQDLSSIMKEIGIPYEAIHAYPDDHVIYYNQHEFTTECLECHVSRYCTDKVTKKVP